MGERIVTVMGIDIKPGHSPRSSLMPRYAVVVLRDGAVVRELDDVPLYSVIRLILEYHVDILAVDNIYELIERQRDLLKLSQIIPSWCKIVETTSTPHGFVSVQQIAKELKLNVEPQTPIRTAYINAYAAHLGYGREIKPPLDRVYIVISKGRTPSQGGTSSERFKRSVRASILRLVREVKELLDRNNLEYDLAVKKSEGGLERGLFVVYAPMEKIRGIVSPIKYKNVRVSIRPAPLRRALSEGKKYVILGIDPGTSIGVAVIDLNGNPLLVDSYKNPDREHLIEEVLSVGKPIVVSVDTSKPPEYAKKIATILGAILYTPEEDLSIEEKQKIALDVSKIHSIEVVDAHARDALAAATKAYKHIKPIIEEVDSKLRGLSGVDKEEVIAKVVKGRSLSDALEEIFMRTLSRDKVARINVVDKSKQASTEEISKLYTRISELENTIKRLEQELKLKEEILKNVEVEIRLLKRRQINGECERKLSQLQIEIESLKRTIEEKNQMLNMLRDRTLELERAILSVSRGKLALACKPPLIQECQELPIYLENSNEAPNYVEQVKNARSGIIVPDTTKALSWEELKVPIVRISRTKIIDMGSFVLFDSSLIEEIKRQWRDIEQLQSLERRERILKTIREYQESRKLNYRL